MIAALMLLWNLSQLWRETNSHAATSHGIKAFAQKKYADAAKSFGSANAISPSPRRAFNLGTAQIAAGNREVGSSTLAKAVADPHLRTDALFNRGNSALSSNAFDYAIHDYADVLRLRPTDRGAKRNLEIALARTSAETSSSAREISVGRGTSCASSDSLSCTALRAPTTAVDTPGRDSSQLSS